MASGAKHWKTFFILISFLRSKTYPDKYALLEHLEDRGQAMSERSLFRRFKDMRTELQIGVEYDDDQRGYYLEAASDWQIDNFMHLFQLADKASFFIDTMEEADDVMKCIQFDTNEQVEGGYNYFADILRAIRERRKLFFKYHSFSNSKSGPHNLDPFLLKEYMGRWYVIGYETHWKGIRTFGLERIESLEVKDEHFEHMNRDVVVDRLSKVVGLIYSKQSPCQVAVRYSAKEAKYQLTQPLHASQVAEAPDEEGNVVIKFFLSPNYEFIQRMLMKGPEIEVLEPQWLRKEMGDWVKRMHNFYQ